MIDDTGDNVHFTVQFYASEANPRLKRNSVAEKALQGNLCLTRQSCLRRIHQGDKVTTFVPKAMRPAQPHRTLQFLLRSFILLHFAHLHH